MKKNYNILFLFPLLLSLQSFKSVDDNEIYDKKLLITLSQKLNKNEFSKILKEESISYNSFKSLDDFKTYYLIDFNKNSEYESALLKLKKNEVIKYIEDDFELIYCGEGVEISDSIDYFEPYNLVKASEAKKLSGNNDTINVAIMDTGINSTGSCFEGKVDENLSKSFSGYNPLVDYDSGHHGSAMSYIIGGTSTSDYFPGGICENVNLISISMPEHPHASDFVSAISYINTLDNVPLINCSYSCGSDYSFALGQVIKDYNGLLICSAGNSGTEITQDGIYPGSLSFDENMIVVGACSNDGESILDDSNFSPTLVDIFAPGELIFYSIGGYSALYSTQTSAATAFVTGACALMLSKDKTLTRNKVKEQILKYADKVDAFKGKCIDGNRLNIFSSIHASNHEYSYTWNNTKNHTKNCHICGETSVEGHVVAGGTILNNKRYATCIYCKGSAEVGFIIETCSLSPFDGYDYIDGLYYPKETQYVDGVLDLSYEDSLKYEEYKN